MIYGDNMIKCFICGKDLKDIVSHIQIRHNNEKIQHAYLSPHIEICMDCWKSIAPENIINALESQSTTDEKYGKSILEDWAKQIKQSVPPVDHTHNVGTLGKVATGGTMYSKKPPTDAQWAEAMAVCEEMIK